MPSTFVVAGLADTFTLLKAGDVGRASVNAGGQVVVGLVALSVGIVLSRSATF